MQTHFGSLVGKTIALWGLAFKPRTDDMREAPAITIVERLVAGGARVQAYDPEAARVAKSIFGATIHIADKGYDALKGADALAIVTEWNEFREPDFDRMRKLMRAPVVFDGRNIYNPEQMRGLGFTYYSIGR
jgi:UDPglucose 6-dehydrogenase